MSKVRGMPKKSVLVFVTQTLILLMLLWKQPNIITDVKAVGRVPLRAFFSNEAIDHNTTRCLGAFQQPHYMTVDSTGGQLGNHMFRLLALLGTARKHCYTPVLRKKSHKLLTDALDLSFLAEMPENITKSQWKHLKLNDCCKYTDEMGSLNTSFNWTFGGFLQSWRYMEGHEEYIRSLIQFKPEVKWPADGIIRGVRQKYGITSNDYVIGVHIRRGDFDHPVNSRRGFTTAGADYLKQAMDYYRDRFREHRVAFIVVSNGMKWAKANVTGTDIFFSSMSAPIDFAVLTMCNHTVITGGTFGYLGAWLNGGSVVYLSDYPEPGTWMDRQTNMSDYYPPKWYPM